MPMTACMEDCCRRGDVGRIDAGSRQAAGRLKTQFASSRPYRHYDIRKPAAAILYRIAQAAKAV